MVEHMPKDDFFQTVDFPHRLDQTIASFYTCRESAHRATENRSSGVSFFLREPRWFQSVSNVVAEVLTLYATSPIMGSWE